MLDVLPKPQEEAEEYNGSGVWNNETLYGLLKKRVAEHPDKVALLGEGFETTFGEWHHQVLSLAGQLQALEIQRGDVVAVQLPYSKEFLISWLAANALGAVLQVIDTSSKASELPNLLDHSSAKLYIGQSDTEGTAEKAVQIMQESASLAAVITLGESIENGIPFGEAIAHDAAIELPACHGDDLLCLIYTGDDQAQLKGVPIKNKWFMGNAYGAMTDWSLSPEDRILTIGEPIDIVGLLTVILTLYTGSQHLLMPTFVPEKFTHFVTNFNPTGIFTAPSHITNLMDAGSLQATDLSGIRFLLLAGATLPEETAAAIDEKLVDGKILQLFAMPEIQCGVYTKYTDKPEVRISTCGRPPNGIALKLVNANGRDTMTGNEGRLLFKGSSVFTGYLNNAQATEAAFTEDGWFISGHTALLTHRGYLQIIGLIEED